MTLDWRPLPWDSEFFGFPIGSVDLDGADGPSLAVIEAEAAQAGILCLYGTLDPVDHRASYVVQQAGYRFVEAATTFSLRLEEPPIICPVGLEVRQATPADLPALAPMVDSLAAWSRFAVDVRFGPEAALRMQRAWAERATSSTTGEYSLMVAEDNTGLLAFITRTVHPTPRVDGVGTTARGSGAARYLIEDARSWAGDQPLLGGPIAARNVSALRYVSHCNYRVSQVRYVYHRWLDEDPGRRCVNTLVPLPPAEDHPGRIPFNRPAVEGREIDYMRAAVERGHTSADGPFSALAADVVRAETGAAEVLLTTSCTAALEMSAMLLDVGPGDTVVVPSFGFVTTALAYSRQGAKVLFCDIDPELMALDPGHLAEIMDDSVRAVVPIHYSGVGCDLEGITSVLERWPRAELVEDNAHGLFGRYRQRPLGSFGRFATLSFHETKNFICGEGGALLVNRPEDVDRARVIYHKGTNRSAFLLGQVDKYSWQDTGSSFGLSDVLGAYLFAQLEQRTSILDRRRRVFDRYFAALEPVTHRFGLTLPVVPADRAQAYHMFFVLLPDVAVRNRVLAAMRAADIHATFHYVPLHSSPHGRRVAAREVPCPVTDDISGRLLRLPFYTGLSTTDQDRVLDAFLGALGSN